MSFTWLLDLTSALEVLDQAGISVLKEGPFLTFMIPVVDQVVIRTKDYKVVDAIISDWHSGVAKYFGVNVFHLKKWILAKIGFPQCSSNTTKGVRCRNIVYTESYQVPNNPKDWNSEAPVYCPKHEEGMS